MKKHSNTQPYCLVQYSQSSYKNNQYGILILNLNQQQSPNNLFDPLSPQFHYLY